MGSTQLVRSDGCITPGYSQSPICQRQGESYGSIEEATSHELRDEEREITEHAQWYSHDLRLAWMNALREVILRKN